MGIKANYRIKTPTEVEFLRGFGVNPKDFIKVNRRGGVFDILRTFGAEFTADLATKLNDYNNIDTGKLIESMKFSLKRFGTVYSFQFSLNDYYKYLDAGRKAGGKMPPPGVLLAWVKRNNYTMSNGPKNKATNQKSLAFLIGRKLKLKGRKGNKFFVSTVKDGRIKQLNDDLSKALKTEVTIDIREFVKEIKKT